MRVGRWLPVLSAPFQNNLNLLRDLVVHVRHSLMADPDWGTGWRWRVRGGTAQVRSWVNSQLVLDGGCVARGRYFSFPGLVILQRRPRKHMANAN